MMNSLSIIVPLYNKEKQIVNTLNSIKKRCISYELDYEIIIVENESTDNSRAVVDNWLIENSGNFKLFFSLKGLGNALKLGITKSTKDYVLFIPADFTFGEAELEYFYKHNSHLNEYIIGSRKHPDSNSSTKFNRILITAGFNLLKRIILNLKIKDTQGTFIIEIKLAKELVNESFSDRFFITTEFIFRIIKKGKKIKEIPVVINFDKDNKTTVKYLVDSLEMLFSLIKLRKIEGKLYVNNPKIK